MATPVHFALCDCEMSAEHPHGYFSVAAGERVLPLPFFSREAARTCLKHLQLDPDNTTTVTEEIGACALPEVITQLDLVTTKVIALGQLTSRLSQLVSALLETNADADTGERKAHRPSC